MKSRSETLDRFVKAFLFYAIMEYYKNLSLESIKYFCDLDNVWKIEEWKDVVGYEGIYMVSDLGRVKSLSRSVKKDNGYRIIKERILKPSIGNHYFVVSLNVDGKNKVRRVHILVSVSFFNHVPCGYELVVNHKNFIKTDNRKVNLEIITQRENTNQKHLNNTSKYVGVHFHKPNNKFCARIYINKNRKCLGYFENEIDAHNAYQRELNLIQ